jgi:hypothetical protein
MSVCWAGLGDSLGVLWVVGGVPSHKAVIEIHEDECSVAACLGWCCRFFLRNDIRVGDVCAYHVFLDIFLCVNALLFWDALLGAALYSRFHIYHAQLRPLEPKCAEVSEENARVDHFHAGQGPEPDSTLGN